MFPQQHFRLTGQAAILAIVSAAFPLAGYCAAAGRADFVVGNVVAVAADGSQRTLAKGSEINVGDAINTASGARAQIRFTDGGYVSLQPNSQFRVDDYHYENKSDGKEKGFFSLLKGGLRTITGAIGHINRDNYKVVTPVATIGIRGTGYNAVLGEGLNVSVADGIISLTNKGGTLILSPGQSAFVANINTTPALTFERPATPPASLTGTTMPLIKTEQYTQGDCSSAAGTTSTAGACGGGTLPINTGLTVITGVAAVGTGGGLALGFGVDFPGVVSFSATGAEVSYLRSDGVLINFAAATLDKATNTAFPVSKYDGTIAWGRFYGPITAGVQSVNLTANQGVHTVVGIPTAAMPTVGTATYTLLGATRPTLDTGAWTPGTVTSGTMIVAFGATPLIEPTSNLVFTMNGSTFTLNFSGSITGNQFTLTSPATTYATGTGSYCNPASCTARVIGFFAGANAARAGIAYDISGGGGVGAAPPLPSTIQGVAAFTR